VEPLAGLPACTRGEQRPDHDRGERDRAAGRERALVHRDARQVEPLEDVPLGAGEHRQPGEQKRHQQPEDPHADALAPAVEAGQPPGHVAAGEVAQEQDDEQQDPAGEADFLGAVAQLGDADRRSGTGQDSRKQRGQPDRDQPAEEDGAPGEAAELLALARSRFYRPDPLAREIRRCGGRSGARIRFRTVMPRERVPHGVPP